MIEQYLGNDDDWNPKLPKTLLDLVSHTHEHITMFSIIFVSHLIQSLMVFGKKY